MLTELIEEYSYFTRYHSLNYDSNGLLVFSKDSLASPGGAYNLKIEEYIYSEGRPVSIHLYEKEVGERALGGEFIVKREHNDRFSIYSTGAKIDSIVSDNNLGREVFKYDFAGNLIGVDKFNAGASNNEFNFGVRFTISDSIFRRSFSFRGSVHHSFTQKIAVLNSSISPLSGLLPFRYNVQFYSLGVPQEMWITDNFRCYPENVGTHVPLNLAMNCENFPEMMERGVQLHACFSVTIPIRTKYIYSHSQ